VISLRQAGADDVQTIGAGSSAAVRSGSTYLRDLAAPPRRESAATIAIFAGVHLRKPRLVKALI
jgi:hypothetical protein